MKKMLLLVLMALALIAAVVIGKLRIDAQRRVEQLKRESSEMQNKHEQELQLLQANIVAWRYCHSNPPTTAEHKVQCRKLDDWAESNAGKEKW